MGKPRFVISRMSLGIAKTMLTSLLLFGGICEVTFAQAAKGVDFLHTPPKLEELPYPGKSVVLSIVLKKEMLSSGMKVRALVTRDGKLVEMQDNDPELDINDRAVYKFDIPSPEVSLGYQFLFQDKVGQTSLSKKYNINRKCRPDVRLVDLSSSKSESVTRDSAPVLVSESRGLERDIYLYEKVISLLGDINKVVEKK